MISCGAWFSLLVLAASAPAAYGQQDCAVLRPLTVRIKSADGMFGAGLIIPTTDGSTLVATSYHVVNGGNMAQVFFWDSPTTETAGSVVFRHRGPSDDLDGVAFLRVNSRPPTSGAPLRVRRWPITEGEHVTFVGHPESLEWQCYPDREVVSRLEYPQHPNLFLLTNPKLVAGLSGGPISDIEGNLIGLMYGQDGSNNAIAIKISVLMDLLKAVPTLKAVPSNVVEAPKPAGNHTPRGPYSELSGVWRGTISRSLIDGDDVVGFIATLEFDGLSVKGSSQIVRFTVLRTTLTGTIEKETVTLKQISSLSGAGSFGQSSILTGKLDAVARTITGTWIEEHAKNGSPRRGTFELRLSSLLH